MAAEGRRRPPRRGLRGGASMGPRPFGRGRTRLRVACIDRAVASMGPRPFGRGRPPPAASCRPGLCVNGAATVWPRKDGGRSPDQGNARRRQWGRDRLAAEGASSPAVWIAARRRQWGRDRLAAEGRYRAGGTVRGLAASMGPRPFGRGRLACACRARRAQIKRQWGRDRLAAEGVRQRGKADRTPSVNRVYA